MILLDTNVVSETQRAAGDRRVKGLVEKHADEVFLSVVVMGELRFGIQRLGDTRRKAALAAWYADLAETYLDVILPVTLEIAEKWGDLSAERRGAGRAVDAPDGLIAATARVHDLTLWTRNTGDFAETGVRLFNPWKD